VYISLWIICDDIVMIIPDIVKDKWKSQPTTLDILKTDLQAEKAKVAKLELLIEGITARMTEHERQTGFRM
jgi:hypothetical protein